MTQHVVVAIWVLFGDVVTAVIPSHYLARPMLRAALLVVQRLNVVVVAMSDVLSEPVSIVDRCISGRIQILYICDTFSVGGVSSNFYSSVSYEGSVLLARNI